MDNAYKGIVELKIWGAKHSVSFEWGKIAQLYTLYGEDWGQELHKAIQSFNPKKIAEILSIVMDGDYSPETIMKMSPPQSPTREALIKAFNYSFYGRETPKGEEVKKNWIMKILSLFQ